MTRLRVVQLDMSRLTSGCRFLPGAPLHLRTPWRLVNACPCWKASLYWQCRLGQAACMRVVRQDDVRANAKRQALIMVQRHYG